MKQTKVYQRIIEILHLSKGGGFTFEELQQRIRSLFEAQGEEEPIYSIRTLQRDLKEIRDSHGVDIQFSKRLGRYVVNEEESSPIQEGVLESFEILQVFQLEKGLDQVVFFDERKARSTKHLLSLTRAIKNKRVLKLNHMRNWMEDKERVLKPLALKQFEHRWYLIALNEQNQLRNYSLEKIDSIGPTSKKFELTEPLDIKHYYKDIFGILNDKEAEAREVILDFKKFKGNYIKASPIHHSQKVMDENEERVRISLFVKINPELISEILSHGNQVTVVSPPELIREIINITEEVVNQSKANLAKHSKD